MFHACYGFIFIGILFLKACPNLMTFEGLFL